MLSTMERNMTIEKNRDGGNFSDTLEKIREFIREHGYPPTVRELCHITGVKSTSAMAYRLQRLANMGFIKLTPNIARGITLVEKELSS